MFIIYLYIKIDIVLLLCDGVLWGGEIENQIHL